MTQLQINCGPPPGIILTTHVNRVIYSTPALLAKEHLPLLVKMVVHKTFAFNYMQKEADRGSISLSNFKRGGTCSL